MADESERMIQQAIFWLDSYQVIRGCEGILINLNGRVPDEGAVAEASMAWMAGKVIVLYKSDVRSLLLGTDNPLVSGLGSFVRVSTIPEIAYAFTQVFRMRRPGRSSERPFPPACSGPWSPAAGSPRRWRCVLLRRDRSRHRDSHPRRRPWASR